MIPHRFLIFCLLGTFVLYLTFLGGCYHDYVGHGDRHGHYAAQAARMEFASPMPLHQIMPSAPMAPALSMPPQGDVTPSAPMMPARPIFRRIHHTAL